jgi:Protein of unknown function (DUF3631)
VNKDTENKLAAKLLKLWRLAKSVNTGGEANSAEVAIDRLLAKHKKSRGDLPELLKLGEQLEAEKAGAAINRHQPASNAPRRRRFLFDLVSHQFQQYVRVKERYAVAATLWALHTHVHRHFYYSPRLSVLSPALSFGKTQLLNVLSNLVPNVEQLNDPSAASLFRCMNEGKTILIDEADNLRLDRTMRTALNGGYENNKGTISRVILGVTERFTTFAPVAIAAIGLRKLPNTLLSRSVIIKMERALVDEEILRVDPNDIEQRRVWVAVYREIEQWALEVRLNQNPEIPRQGHRNANNWRALLAIADDLEAGDVARTAMVEIMAEYVTEDIPTYLLRDIRIVFDEQKCKAIWSETLIEHLHNLENEYDWAEHKLTKGKMARILYDFGMKSQSAVWLPERQHRSQQSAKRGYVRSDFEMAWARYCPIKTDPIISS